VLTGAVRGGDVSFWKQEGRSVWIRMRGYLTAGAAAGWVVGVGIAEACMNVVRYCLVAVGLVALWRRPARSECILAMLLLGYFVAITGHDGCARFRMLIESLLISLAAGGLDAWLARKRSHCHETRVHRGSGRRER
ncbi:hypothetical protein EBZ39_19505, partial [bacterium]|nr:hypothetical protein [bacterium]